MTDGRLQRSRGTADEAAGERARPSRISRNSPRALQRRYDRQPPPARAARADASVSRHIPTGRHHTGTQVGSQRSKRLFPPRKIQD